MNISEELANLVNNYQAGMEKYNAALAEVKGDTEKETSIILDYNPPLNHMARMLADKLIEELKVVKSMKPHYTGAMAVVSLTDLFKAAYKNSH